MLSNLAKNIKRLSVVRNNYIFRRNFAETCVQHIETAFNNDSVPFDFTEENYKQINTLL